MYLVCWYNSPGGRENVAVKPLITTPLCEIQFSFSDWHTRYCTSTALVPGEHNVQKWQGFLGQGTKDTYMGLGGKRQHRLSTFKRLYHIALTNVATDFLPGILCGRVCLPLYGLRVRATGKKPAHTTRIACSVRRPAWEKHHFPWREATWNQEGLTARRSPRYVTMSHAPPKSWDCLHIKG